MYEVAVKAPAKIAKQVCDFFLLACEKEGYDESNPIVKSSRSYGPKLNLSNIP